MSATPLVSIVIACFEYGRFLEEAIQSALAQTVDIEVIVIDDGSTDDSVTVARRHPVRVDVLNRVGVCRVRNHGASLARGRYLLFLDADDRLPSDYTLRCLAALERAPARVAYAYTPMDLFGTETGRFPSRPFAPRSLVVGNFVHVSALVRREAFEQVGGFDPNLRLGWEDYDLWLRLLDRGFHGTFVPETALQYRRHGPSRNTLSKEQQAYLKRLLALRYPRLFWRDFVTQPAALAETWLTERLAEDAPSRPAPKGRPTDGPDISVVLVHSSSREDLERSLTSLVAQTEHGFETLVVEDGEKDASLEALAHDVPSLRILSSDEKAGFAESCNRGIDLARGTWVLILRSGAEAEPACIAELRRVVSAAGERLGMVQSRVISRERSADVARATKGAAPFLAGVVDEDLASSTERSTTPGEIFCASTGAALYRKRMLDEARLASGVFDPTFLTEESDLDLGWRCRLAGWEALYAPAATVHADPKTHETAAERTESEALRRGDRLRMALKNGSMRMFAREVPQTVQDALWLTRAGGLGSLRGYRDAALQGLRQRAGVTSRLKLQRREVERRWLSSPKS
ncbi:MAG: glycosyltransferase [Deltaproteobacteria bacterium]|nr:glycosyltransferase [Deltaproteobacteria bacterium]